MIIYIIYHLFSLLFMLGYIEFGYEEVWKETIAILISILFAPILFPINLGKFIRVNTI